MEADKLIEYLENNKSISFLLAENENILRSAGYVPPCMNFVVEDEKRINIPAGYIRTSKEFWNKYHLGDLVESLNTRKNISYALQLSDLYNFLLNRFYMWGSVEIMLYKQAFVNIVSIIEALILESSNRINLFCKQCSNISKCQNNICQRDRENMKCAAEKLFELGILDINEVEKNRLIELYDLRNKIHIRLNDQNEFLDYKYNRALYNEVIEMLQKVDDCLWKNAVPLYKKCIGYKSK